MKSPYSDRWVADSASSAGARISTSPGVAPRIGTFLCFPLLLCASFANAQWEQVQGPYGGYVNAIACTGTAILAGTEGGGVCRSTNDGESWVTSSSGLGNSYIEAFLVRNGEVFAGTSGNGVFRSTDDGVTWKPANNGLGQVEVHAFLDRSSELFVAVYDWAGGEPLYKSTDDGNSWVVEAMGMQYTWPTSFAVHRGAIFLGFDGGLYHSTDDGITWWPDTIRNWGAVNDLLSVGDTLLAACSDGILISSAGISSWVTSNTGFPNPVPSVRSLKMDRGVLFAATDGGVYRSADMGATWGESDVGLSFSRTKVLSVAPHELYLGTRGGGVFCSTDEGLSWTACSAGISSTTPIACYNDAGVLVVATGNSGAFVSTDEGVTWAQRSAGLARPNLTALAKLGYQFFVGTTTSGVFRSSDVGVTWSAANTGIGSLLVQALASEGSTVFLGTADNAYRSTDSGDSWVIDNPGAQGVQTFGVANGCVYLGGGGGELFRSSDEGATWSDIGAGRPWTGVYSIAATNDTIFVTGDGGACYSTAGGLSWSSVAGCPDTLVGTAILVQGGTVFCGTDLGVFRFRTDGTGWSGVNDGLINLYIRTLFVHGGYLYAGTDGCGLWRRPLPQIVLTGFNKQDPALPSRFSLAQNFPDPFNPSTTIRYALPRQSHVQIEVFNFIGQKIVTLVSRDEEPGYHEVQFNGSGLATGVYLYRIQAGSFVATRKLILLK